MIGALVMAMQVALSPCTIEEVTGEARCGTYEVWENRSAGSGRRLPLKVVVLAATTTRRAPDALFVLQGGPGQGVTQLADFYARVFAEVRRTRDIVLVDLRGTGESAPLLCPELADPQPDGSLSSDLLDTEAVRRCRDRLAQSADLQQYTTEIAIADLDEVRAALGYDRVNLYGTSYGSRAALVYARDYPHRVRTVAMKGIVPPSLAMPATHAVDGQRAWVALLERCRADETCRQSFPSLQQDFESLLARFERPVLLASGGRGAARGVVVSRGLLGEALRNLFYTPENLARLPGIVRRMAAGDDAQIADIAARTRLALGSGALAAGFFLSVTCAEDVPFLPPDADAAAAATYGGDYRLQQQRRACALWPRGAVSARHRQPLLIRTPLLMFSGEFDPVTPPANGDEVKKLVPDSVHVIVKNNGHPFGKLEGCGNRLIAQLIEDGSTNALDVSCAAQLPPVPFAPK